MKVNMKNLNSGEWFFFDDKKPDDGRINIRILSHGKLAEVREKAFKTKREWHGSVKREWTETDDSVRDRIVWDYCIVDWENLEDEDGNPIECNTDNKLLLMNNQPRFAALVENCLNRLNEQEQIYRDYLEKN